MLANLAAAAGDPINSAAFASISVSDKGFSRLPRAWMTVASCVRPSA